MPTVEGDGDIYKELIGLLLRYDKAVDKIEKLSEERIPNSEVYRDFLAISYRLNEINVNGRNLAEERLVKKLREEDRY